MSEFRTVYFRPRLALDWKIPVAAFVRTPQGLARLQADIIPDPRCLGSVASFYVLKNGLNKLSTALDWHELPSSVGPHFELGAPIPMPDVSDPIAWVKHRTLPDREISEGEKNVGTIQIKTVAWNHLSAWNASRYVERNLKRGKIEEAEKVPDNIGITHYVQGTDKVLLMEPILLSQSPINAARSIFLRFSTYLYNWEHTGRVPEPIVYILPGPYLEKEALSVKEQLAHLSTVLFTGRSEDRNRLVSTIESVGATAELVQS